MTNVLQGVLTEGDTGKPFFSDRDTSEEPTYDEVIYPIDRLEELLSKAELLGHRTVSVEEIRQIYPKH